MALISQSMEFFDFHKKQDLSNWRVVNDDVMGGRSTAEFFLNTDGHAVFQGAVSLDNYGGFSSVRYQFSQKNLEGFSNLVLRIKGDGKRYQFRVKANRFNRHSYIQYFKTTGEWQTIEIPLKEMIPTFRGRQLDMPNFPVEKMEELAILVGNKKEEEFKLELDHISLK